MMNNKISAVLLASALGVTCSCEQYGSDAHASDSRTWVERATAVLMPVGDSGVAGTVTLVATADGVRVAGELTGLSPGKHGFHVHEFGNLQNQEDGSSAGGHFAPEGHDHGRPGDEQRHAGDLGNIEAGEDGRAAFEMVDDRIRLNGPHSIVGRAIVVHAGEDKFTQPSGGAGPRVAFGVIGIAAAD